MNIFHHITFVETDLTHDSCGNYWNYFIIQKNTSAKCILLVKEHNNY